MIWVAFQCSFSCHDVNTSGVSFSLIFQSRSSTGFRINSLQRSIVSHELWRPRCRLPSVCILLFQISMPFNEAAPTSQRQTAAPRHRSLASRQCCATVTLTIVMALPSNVSPSSRCLFWSSSPLWLKVGCRSPWYIARYLTTDVCVETHTRRQGHSYFSHS